jgi:putative membrane protein
LLAGKPPIGSLSDIAETQQDSQSFPLGNGVLPSTDRNMTMYEWAKALHVIAVISWMAGMLYLPRLFVYHCEAAIGSPQSETFKVMERRLLKAIINPAMAATWVLGLYLAWWGHWFTAGWFHGKLLLVVLMSGVHGFLSRCVRDFAADQNSRSQKFYRIINEVPAVLMIGIVILVVVKPF